jgi:hypothetical protein
VNVPTVAVGVAAILFGLYTAWARAAKPEQLGKLEAMKKHWGAGPGYAVHFVGYTVVPVVAGAVFVWTGLQGYSFFG